MAEKDLLPYEPVYETKDPVKIKTLDEHLIHTPNKLREFLRPKGPYDTSHGREEPDVSGTYSKGGSVRKFGSSTCVTAKDKFS